MPGAIGSLFGGGNSTSFNDVAWPRFMETISPGYKIYSAQGEGGVLTDIKRLNTAANRAYDERFPRILEDIDRLRGTITPGFSTLRESRLRQIESGRTSALGNLRETFARRRLAGSSFAVDKAAQVEREFSQARSDAEAASFLEELEANKALLSMESLQVGQGLARELEELGIATGQANALAQLASQNRRFQTELAAQENAAAGAGLGNLLGLGLSLATAPFGGSLLGSALGIGGTLGGASAPIGLSAGGGLNRWIMSGAARY